VKSWATLGGLIAVVLVVVGYVPEELRRKYVPEELSRKYGPMPIPPTHPPDDRPIGI